MHTHLSSRTRASRMLTLTALLTVATGLVMLGASTRAHAQDDGADIELGATEASYGGSARASSSARPAASNNSSSDVRLGLQIRLDALTMLGPLDSTPSSARAIGQRLLVPVATLGVRFLEGRLFLGTGLGLHGWSNEEPNGDEQSRSGFGISPLATFDVIREASAALSIGGALHLASLGETENCGGPTNACVDANNDASGVGLSLLAGVRGMLLPGLALGGDFGWGFLSLSSDNDDSTFLHSFFAALVLEATVGL